MTFESADTVAALLRRGALELREAGADSASLDARILLGRRLNMSAAQMETRGEKKVAAEARRGYESDIGRRRSGEPVSYITGRREFMGLEFLATPAALSPRPETEELTEAALAHLPADAPRRALDLGAGGGAIGLSIARFRPRCRVRLADQSEAALALAKKNAARLQVANADFCRGDWWENIDSKFDVIVANPPYIRRDDAALSALRFEPTMALCGGEDGLEALRIVIGGAPARLRRGGALLVEHGATQQNDAKRLFAAAGFCGIACLRDLANLPRITLAVLG